MAGPLATQSSLTITTILGEQTDKGNRGPFLLVAVQGVEGVSIPYSFDLTLYRSLGAEDVDVSLLVNTPAKFGVLHDGNYLTRCGVFRSFEKAGTTEKSKTAQTDFVVYRARIVPAIAMLEFEQVFRVFERMTVVDILNEAIGDFANLRAASYLLPKFGAEVFPPIDYCVQFNETTWTFVSRLLAEHGIWYYFEHPGPSDSRGVEQMVLGRTPVGFTACEDPAFEIDASNFHRAYQIAHRKVTVGDYNVLQPNKPFSAEVSLLDSYDSSPADDAFGTRIRSHAFPGASPRGGSGGDAGAAKFDAAIRQEAEEARVFTAQGQGKNKTFRAGRRFTTTDTTEARKLPEPRDKFGPPAEGDYLLTVVSISAIENSAGHTFLSDVLNFINPFHWFSRDDPKKNKVVDVTAQIAGSSLYESLSKQAAASDKAGKAVQDITSKIASYTGAFSSVFSFFADSISEIIANHSDEFSVSFVAVPFKAGQFMKLPLPTYEPARARGPQLAVVIGPKGVKDNPSDHHVDALGRVRVRFPWHTDLPDGGEQDPWKTDRRTAWLRVADGWAGNGMGTQFLPRIGDEVVVSFVDGDPSRPLVTGRLYNAGAGLPGQPFPPNRTAAKSVDNNAVHEPSPAAGSLRSGIRTRSTPKPQGAKDRFHLLRFDDAWHDEQLLIRSQGRTDVTSFGAWHDTSHGNRSILVGGKDPDTGKGGGAMFVTTGAEYDHHVGGSHYQQTDKSYQLTVKSVTALDLQSSYVTIVKDKAELNASEIVLEASKKITLKVGGSFVVIDPMGVFIKGAVVKINSGGSPGDTASMEMTDVADAGPADPGDPPDWLALHPPGKGGKRGTHTAEAKHGLLVTKNADGSYQVTKGVRVKGTDDYCDSVIQDLATINDTKDGKARLDRLDSSGKQTTIQNFDASNPKTPQPNATTMPADWVGATAPGKMTDPALSGGSQAVGNGTGSDSDIRYDPADWPDPTSRTKAPGDVILNHELGHADNNAHGKQDGTPTSVDSYGNMEEFNNLPADNSYRRERNPDPDFQRKDYGDF